jgi:hypothetical protein
VIRGIDVLFGTVTPPDFKDIANNDWTAESLQHHLQNLPAVPKKPGMPNLDLTKNELRDVAAFIFTFARSRSFAKALRVVSR